MSAPKSRVPLDRCTLLRAGAGMAGILATGRAPAFAQTQPKKLVFAHINAIPESAAVAFDWMAKEVTAQSKGALEMQFFGKTLIPQELEIMNAVKTGSVAMGSPAVTAAKQGVIDGGDLPVVNMKALKIYEVSKYASLTYHNYGPTNALMNLEVWNGLTPDQQKLIMDLSRAAQEKIREATESVDNFAKAKSELEPLGMTVVEAKVEEFKKVAQQKIWPAYKSQYGALWDEIEGFKA